ncbi:MAG: adenylate/guanylate cyclase domain-containing protein [Bacteroidia bacterium]|nr:adenylate/guanylate cyclase domain-containing protein [Bacteroidia bacterium]
MTNYRSRFSLLLFLVLLLWSCKDTNKRPPKAVKGHLDLSQWDFVKDGNVKLDGEAAFWWKKFPEFSSPDSTPAPSPDLWVNLPVIWNGFELNGEKLGGMGYGTYQLMITLPASCRNQIMAISSQEQSTAFEVLIDDQVLMQSGTVGTDREHSKPYTIPNLAAFVPPASSFNLVLRISNFHHRVGGVRQSILLGNYDQVSSLVNHRKEREWVLLGIIFIIIAYHLILYLFRRKDKTPLYFSLICLVVFFRAGITGQKVLAEEFDFIPYGAFITLEYLTYFLSIPLSLHYIYYLFPGSVRDWILKWSYYLSLPFIAVALALPVYMSSQIIPAFHLIFLSGLIFMFFKLIQLTLKKVPYAGILLLSGGIMMLTTLNDILYVNQIIFTGYLVHVGLIFLIFSQALVLARKFSNAFSDNETLLIATQKFVPVEFLKKLKRPKLNDLKLGDQIEASMTILFVDIRSFTTMSEKMQPDENFNFINDYLRRVGPIIRNNDGFIDKYIGDAIMALFEKPDQALKSAMEISREVEKYNLHRAQEGLEPIEVGMGINTGNLMMGIIGEDERLEGTVISDTVNLASRLEGTTKTYNSVAIFSEFTLADLSPDSPFNFRKLDLVKVKGKSNSVLVYELLDCLPAEDREQRIAQKASFNEALEAYWKKDYVTALESFSRLHAINPRDKAALYYVQHCKKELTAVDH